MPSTEVDIQFTRAREPNAILHILKNEVEKMSGWHVCVVPGEKCAEYELEAVCRICRIYVGVGSRTVGVCKGGVVKRGLSDGFMAQSGLKNY